MSNKFQLKRTSVSGRTPNTTNSANTSYIDAGELAINMADGRLYSSNGSFLMEFGAGTPVYDENGSLITTSFVNLVHPTAITSHLIPNANVTYDLGTANNRWRDLYLSNNSLYLGPLRLTANATNLSITDAANNTVSLGGDGNTVGGNTALDLRNYSDTVAATAYSNATAFAADATNITSGTIAGARLPAANVTTAGGVILLDSVSNTFVATYAPTMNAVKTAYDLAGNAVANAISYAAAAYSNAATYAATIAGTAYTNATAFAANASNISSGTLDNGRLAATVNIVTALNVGTGVNLTTSSISVGNATVNTQITAGNIALNGSTLTIGNALSNTTLTGESMTMTGALTVGNTNIIGTANVSANLTANNVRLTGDLVIDGNLTVTGTSVTLNVASLSVEDNMIYLNGGSQVTNPDLGIAGNYNDGTYKHAGIFRDATDGRWKFFHEYSPEPDASAFIDTANASFTLANVQAHTFIGAGSLSTLATGNTVVTGTVNVSSTFQASGATTINNTLATGNTTVTGFANVSSTLQVTGATTLSSTLASGNTTITGFANVSSTLSVTGNTTFGDIVTVGTGFSASAAQLVVYGRYFGANTSGVLSGRTADQLVFGAWKDPATDLPRFIVSAGHAANDGIDISFGTASGSNFTTATFAPRFTIKPSGLITFANSTATSVTIAANGNVGITNTTPVDKLSVGGTLATGNTTITGFANVSSTLQVTGAATLSSTLGIGTTNPNAARLHVAGTSTGPDLSTTAVSDASAVLGNSDRDYGTYFATYASGAGAIQQRRGATAVFYNLLLQPHGGNIGIGTNTQQPQNKFVVSDNGASGLEVSPTGGVSSGVLLQAYNRSTSAYMQQSYYALGHTFNVGSSGNVRALDIAANGNIGIGNTSPAAQLYLYKAAGNAAQFIESADASGYAVFQLKNSGASGRGYEMGVGGSTASSPYNGNFYLYDLTAGAPRMLLSSNGNLGVGNTTPNARLVVNGDGGDALPVLRVNSANAVSSFNWAASFINSGLGSGRTTLALIGQAESSKNSGYIGFNHSGTSSSNSNFLTFGLYGIDHILNIRGTLGGSVGIGNTTPDQKLTVAGNIQLIDGNADGPQLILSSSGYTDWALDNNTGRFRLYAGATEYFTLAANGNLGVSNTAPSYKLHVQGDIYASGNVYSASDRRLKTDIEIIDEPIERVKKLNGIFYRAINDTNRSTGIIAQDALNALPEVVTQDSTGLYGVNYGNIVGLLVEAIKKQQEQIEVLEQKLSRQNGVS